MLSDSISWICTVRLFFNIEAAVENNLVPKVAGMHSVGWSNTIKQCNLNEYIKQDLLLIDSLIIIKILK